jgi:hypothetical protein
MAKRLKRRLTEQEEFDIMKLVLDKFLWLGMVIMGYGLYLSLTHTLSTGIWYIISGAVVLILFAWFIVKEFEFIR